MMENKIMVKFTSEQIEYMRNFKQYEKIIEFAKKKIENNGKDFNEEFKKWEGKK